MLPARGNMEIDLSQLDSATAKKVDEIFRGDHELKVMAAIRRQTQLAARNHRGERSVNGIGGRKFEVDAVFDALWRQFYGHDYSADPELLKFLGKRNPEIVVKTGLSQTGQYGTRIQVGYSSVGRGKKYSRKF